MEMNEHTKDFQSLINNFEDEIKERRDHIDNTNMAAYYKEIEIKNLTLIEQMYGCINLLVEKLKKLGN
jgi:hypothetical protein